MKDHKTVEIFPISSYQNQIDFQPQLQTQKKDSEMKRRQKAKKK